MLSAFPPLPLSPHLFPSRLSQPLCSIPTLTLNTPAFGMKHAALPGTGLFRAAFWKGSLPPARVYSTRNALLFFFPPQHSSGLALTPSRCPTAAIGELVSRVLQTRQAWKEVGCVMPLLMTGSLRGRKSQLDLELHIHLYTK